jgi:undecaprenyl pyrophosphate synthase
MQVTVEQIENEVKQLSTQDLRKVRDLVDSLLEEKESKPQMTEEEFEQYLYEKGVIGKPPLMMDFSCYKDYRRVTVEGEPVSETIIKERR